MSQPQQQQRLKIYGKYQSEFKTLKEWKDFEKELKKQIAESQRKSVILCHTKHINQVNQN